MWSTCLTYASGWWVFPTDLPSCSYNASSYARDICRWFVHLFLSPCVFVCVICVICVLGPYACECEHISARTSHSRSGFTLRR